MNRGFCSTARRGHQRSALSSGKFAGASSLRQVLRRFSNARQERGEAIPPTACFEKPAKDIRGVSDNSRINVRLKKRMLRTLIEEILAQNYGFGTAQAAVSATPEPTTLAAMPIGAAMLLRRRRDA